MTRLRLASISLVTLLAACGGSVTEIYDATGGSAGTAGSAGSSTGGSSTGGSSAGGSSTGGSGMGGAGGAVDACAVAAPGQGPWQTDFRFVNSSGKPVYLYQGCSLQFDIRACSEGYASAVPISGDCTSECSEVAGGGGCMVCGACQQEVIELKPGQSQELSWAGYRYTFGTVDGCPCHDTHVAPAGVYRVSVSVWNAPFDPWSPSQPTATISQDFQHGLDKTVTVQIGL